MNKSSINYKFLKKIPKTELHIHVEGTALYKVDHDDSSSHPIDFFLTWKDIIHGFSSYTDVKRSVEEYFLYLKRNNVIWAECFISPYDLCQSLKKSQQLPEK